MRSLHRAQRRHHRARRKQRVERELAHLLTCSRHRRKVVGILAETPVRCSCWMCGNPRRYHGELTMQELRGLLRADDVAF